MNTFVEVKPTYGIVSASLMRNSSLSIGAKALYALLKTYTGEDKSCFPSSDALALHFGLTRRTIQRLLNELKRNNIIVTYTSWNPEKQRRARLIRIVDNIETNKASVE